MATDRRPGPTDQGRSLAKFEMESEPVHAGGHELGRRRQNRDHVGAAVDRDPAGQAFHLVGPTEAMVHRICEDGVIVVDLKDSNTGWCTR
jgi:hypothetical protein